MARKPAAPTAGLVEARVLLPCAWGQPNDVVALEPDQAAAGAAAAELDPTPEAVAYAKSLNQE